MSDTAVDMLMGALTVVNVNVNVFAGALTDLGFVVSGPVEGFRC